MNPIIGVGFNTGMVGGDLERLAARLAHMETIGCTGAEITAVGLDAVVNCRLIPDRVNQLRELLARHTLAYSMHAPIAINLMDQNHASIMIDAATASLQLAAEIGCQVVVLHPGRVAPKDWVDRQSELLKFEIDQLTKVADYASAMEIQIAYENISPNARVIAGLETSYSLDPLALAMQLNRLDHKAVMACLDISHAQQGAGLWGFDMVESCCELDPWIGHIHYSDSTGVPVTFPTGSRIEEQFFGVGDMHAPPGYGQVEFDRLASVLKVRQNTRIVIELTSNFLTHADVETLQKAQHFAANIAQHEALAAQEEEHDVAL